MVWSCSLTPGCSKGWLAGYRSGANARIAASTFSARYGMLTISAFSLGYRQPMRGH